jgi:hypothetical protein
MAFLGRPFLAPRIKFVSSSSSSLVEYPASCPNDWVYCVGLGSIVEIDGGTGLGETGPV